MSRHGPRRMQTDIPVRSGRGESQEGSQNGARSYWNTVLDLPLSSTRPAPSSHHSTRPRGPPLVGSSRSTQAENTSDTSHQQRARQSSELNQGTRLQSGTAPTYFCNLCRRTFFHSPAELAQHKKDVHGQDRPYVCRHCGMRFAQRSHLNQHVKTVHEKQRPFRCGICDKSFGKRFDLQSHQDAVHGNVKGHKCSVCGKAFAKRSNLTRHIASVHSGTLPGPPPRR